MSDIGYKNLRPIITMKRHNKLPTAAEVLSSATDARQDKIEASKAWAKFLIDQYRRDQLLLVHKEHEIIEIPTNHDKLNV